MKKMDTQYRWTRRLDELAKGQTRPRNTTWCKQQNGFNRDTKQFKHCRETNYCNVFKPCKRKKMETHQF